MSKLFQKENRKIGLPPGILLHIGEDRESTVSIEFLEYNEKKYREEKSIFPLIPQSIRPGVKWINIDGVHNEKVIEEFGNKYKIHSLVLEDILHTEQRPKLDLYDDYLFIVLNMLSYDQNNEEVLSEQVSIILVGETVLSFQERPGDVFDLIRDRIRYNKGLIRKNTADYLIYALLDAIVDNYFLVLEKMEEKIEELEQKIIDGSEEAGLGEIQFYKKELMFIRKSVWPLREIFNTLIKNESGLMKKDTIYYLQDIYDHLIQIIDIIESLREMLTGLLDIYLSSTSNKMNEVMKVLTVISTIFIPMTFITGLYGMNFKYMPELKMSWGYPAVLGIMIIITVSMILYFKKKKWF